MALGGLALLVEYEGTDYCGFQLQAHGLTIQEELERAILGLTGERCRVVAASRTDAGVHALGQVVAFRTGSALPPATFVRGLNHYLPQAITVRAAAQVSEDFNPRRQAVSREYRYLILNSPAPSPLWRRHAWWLRRPLDLGAMEQAAQAVLGTRNLAAFAPPGIAKTVRTVHSAGWRRQGRVLAFTMVADSFLTQQVRRTVGALTQVGQGKMTPEAFRLLVASGRPGSAEPAAPAQGLYLVRVNFKEELFDNQDL